MKAYQKQFIEMAISAHALKFGQFTLKSGRVSPYFFNIGELLDAEYLTKLGEIYAEAIMDAGIDYDVLFGPAYKGIPLTCTTSIALKSKYNLKKSISFNRKEVKDHGEGGQLIGAKVRDQKILLIDDVITAGTAIRESMQLLSDSGAKLAGVIIALDRQERGLNHDSAMKEIAKHFSVPVFSIITLENIIDYVKNNINDQEIADNIVQYQLEYGCNTVS